MPKTFYIRRNVLNDCIKLSCFMCYFIFLVIKVVHAFIDSLGIGEGLDFLRVITSCSHISNIKSD